MSNIKNKMLERYETDDIEQVRLVSSNNKNVSVVYNNPNIEILPKLTFKTNGHSYTKWNPEYVEHIRRKYPDMSDDELAKYMKMTIEKPNSSNIRQCETDNSSKNIRKRTRKI